MAQLDLRKFNKRKLLNSLHTSTSCGHNDVWTQIFFCFYFVLRQHQLTAVYDYTISVKFIFNRSEIIKLYWQRGQYIMKRKFKQWWASIPISTSHLSWDREKNVVGLSPSISIPKQTQTNIWPMLPTHYFNGEWVDN